MRYTWRIIFTSLLLLSNAISLSHLEDITIGAITAYVVNIAFGWIIGYQIDKYRFSKKELRSVKSNVIDFSYALDSVPIGIGITNQQGQFEYVNEAHRELYGYSKAEMLNMRWQDLYTEEIENEILSIAGPNLQEQGEWRGGTVGVRKDGSTFPIEIHLSTIDETRKIICVVRDVTKEKQYIENIKHIAEHNDLTGLPNRRKLLSDINKSEKESKNTTFLFIDLDRFKLVNDTLGHDIGDVLLIKAAQRLVSFQNESIKVYHQGGDEFIALIHNSTYEFVEVIANRIITAFREPFYLNENEVTITTSIGISRYPDHTNHFNELIKLADTAMYYAKLEGKNTLKFFSLDLKSKLERNANIEAELRKAILNDELLIKYQPKFTLMDSKIVGMEALLRWENEKLGKVSPVEFIPIAEDTGLINDIGNWVIKEVLSQMAKWQSQGYPIVKMSVNVSQRQFRSRRIVDYINSSLESYQIEPQFFEIEITEGVMEEFELVIPQLKTLKDLNVGISIDDFGTGYSSLNFIKNLPVDTLKIDQSFIRGLSSNDNSSSLVKAIIEIGNTLNLKVVAEGIETEEHLNKLKQLDCPIGQGYYFSEPLVATEIESKYLKTSNM